MCIKCTDKFDYYSYLTNYENDIVEYELIIENENKMKYNDYLIQNIHFEMINGKYFNLFHKACIHNCINFAKYLYQNIENINVHIPIITRNYCITNVFNYSCMIGNLTIAKWLYSINPNVDSFYENNKFENEDEILGYYHIVRSLQNKHYNVVKWLFNIFPIVNIIILPILENNNWFIKNYIYQYNNNCNLINIFINKMNDNLCDNIL